MNSTKAKQKHAYQAVTMSMIGGGILLSILFFDPTFTTLNGGAVGSCRFAEGSPSNHFLGPTTAFIISQSSSDFHLFWELAIVLCCTALAGYFRHGQWGWLNSISILLNILYSIVIIGWMLNTVGCYLYTTLGHFEQGVAVLGTFVGCFLLVIGSALLSYREPLPPSYQEQQH